MYIDGKHINSVQIMQYPLLPFLLNGGVKAREIKFDDAGEITLNH